MEKTSKRLYRYIIKQKKKILLGILATLLMSLVELATGGMLKFLTNLIEKFSGTIASGEFKKIQLPIRYNIKIPFLNEKINFVDVQLTGRHEVFKGMVILCLVFLALYFLLALFNYLRRVYMITATQRILQNFKEDIYHKALRLPLSFFDRNKTGDVVSRITYDVTTLNEIIDLLIEVARTGIYMLVFIPVMFYMSWQLTLFTILFFPLSAILVEYVTRSIKKVSKRITDNVGDYTAFLEEKINKFRLIKGFGKEKEEGAVFSDLVEENYQHNLKLIKLRFSMNPTNDFLGMIALSLVYVYYSYQLTNGHSTLGDIVFYLFLVRTAYKPVKKVAEAWGQLHVALVSTKKIFRLLDEPEEKLAAEPKAMEPIRQIRFSEVHFSYPNGNNEILKGINGAATKGDRIGLTGKTGAGKTTLLNLLPAFYQPASGAIYWNDTNYAELSFNDIRNRVIYVGTGTPFMNGTIRQNLEYSGNKIPEHQLEMVISFLGVAGKESLDRIIGKDGIELSAGQNQKMAFLRAILVKPEVLIMDEIFSSLDTEDIHQLMQICSQVPVLFMVSRKVEVLNYATQIWNLSNGLISV